MKHLKKLFVACFALIAFAASAQQMPIPPLPLDPAVRTGKLENGLTYYIRHNEMPKDRANFYIAQKVGSVQEEENQRGLAHFLEHMCFNGTKTFPGNSLIQYCESIGVKFGQNLNAYTSTDETVYNINDVPVTVEANIDNCLMILHDWAGCLLLEDEEIDKERGVIHEEWRTRTSATMRILERQLENLYPGSRYGRRMPIGTMDVIDNFPYDALRSYYKKWYHPSLQGIIVVGDVDVDLMEQKIKNLFSDLVEPADAEPYVDYPVPGNEHPIYIIDKDKEQTTCQISAIFKCEPLPAELKNTSVELQMDYMSAVLTSAMNARLQEKAQEPDCPYLVASCREGKYVVSKTMNSFEVGLAPKPGMAPEALKAVMAEVERARQHGFLSTEIQRASDEFLSRMEKYYQNRDKEYNDSYCKELIRHFLVNEAVPGIETEFAIYQQLAAALANSPDVFGRVLQEFTASIDSNFVVFATYPDNEQTVVNTADELKAVIEEARATQYEAFVDEVNNDPFIPVMPKPGKIKAESEAPFGYTCWTLKNGARVFFKQTDFNASEVVFSAISKGGSSLLPVEDVKNAGFLKTVMASTGIGAFSSTELEKKLAGKQLNCGVSVNQLTERASGSSTPKDLRTLFELIYLGFQQPGIDQKGYDNLMAAVRTSLENAERNPMLAYSDSVQQVLYGHQPRLFRLQHLSDMEGLDYAEVRRIYADRFKNGGDFDFYFTGAFDVDSLRLFTEQYLAPLKAQKKRETYVDHHIDMLTGSAENIFARDMETPQARVMELWHGEYPHTIANELAVDALGTILRQRYLKSIREDAGIAYSVGASAQLTYGTRDEYVIQIVCPVKPDRMQDALRLMKVELDDIAANGVKEEELAKVREFMLKTYADNQKENDYWHSLIEEITFWNKDGRTGCEEAVKTLSSEQLQQFTRHMLQEGNCRIVGILPTDMTE